MGGIDMPIGGGQDMHMTARLLQQSLDARLGKDKAIVAPLWAGPQILVFSCILAFGKRPEEIEQMAGALAQAAQSEACRVARAAGKLLIEIPRPDAERLPLRAERLEAMPPKSKTAVPLGISTGGKVVWLDLADERQATVLIGGSTGSGKSTELKWLLYRLLAQNTPDELRLVVADPKVTNKREGLRPFAYVPHLAHPIQSDAFETMRLLTWVMMEIKRREAIGATEPRLLLVVEEVKHFIDQNRDISRALADILQIGRGWGVNTIVTTQHPGAKSIGDGLPNLLVTLLGRVVRETQAYGAAGRAGTDAAALLGRGDMLYIGAGETVRFQAPYADGRQWVKIKHGMPGDLTAQLPRPDMLQINATHSGKTGKVITPADIDALRPAIAAGRGVEYVRQALGIGTDRARVLHTQIQRGEL